MPETTSESASRQINAAPGAIFALLADPARHAEFDGSGFVRSADKPHPITASGQTFRMNMEGEHMGGEYQTDNLVTGFQPNKLIAWKTAPAGTEPPGWEWVYELEPEGSDSTLVTLTYDWGKVSDSKLLADVGFPLVPTDALDDSLARLASVVGG